MRSHDEAPEAAGMTGPPRGARARAGGSRLEVVECVCKPCPLLRGLLGSLVPVCSPRRARRVHVFVRTHVFVRACGARPRRQQVPSGPRAARTELRRGRRAARALRRHQRLEPIRAAPLGLPGRGGEWQSVGPASDATSSDATSSEALR